MYYWNYSGDREPSGGQPSCSSSKPELEVQRFPAARQTSSKVVSRMLISLKYDVKTEDGWMKPCELAVQIFPTNTWTFTKATVRHGTVAVRSACVKKRDTSQPGWGWSTVAFQPCIHPALNKRTFRKGKDPCPYLLITLWRNRGSNRRAPRILNCGTRCRRSG